MAATFETGHCHMIAQGRHGTFIINKFDAYLGQSILQYGEYSPVEAQVLDMFLSEGDVAVEVGANYGLLTVPLAKSVGPTGTVIAIEPQKVVHNALCGTLALNDITHVQTHNVAVGAEKGDAYIPSTSSEKLKKAYDLGAAINSGAAALVGAEAEATDRVPMITLDSLNLPVVKVLKIDVEGYELEVLKGASETLARCRPVVYAENDRIEKSSELLKHLEDAGYKCYWHGAPLFVPNNFKGNPQDIYDNIVSVNVLCLPVEMELPFAGATPAVSSEPHPLSR